MLRIGIIPFIMFCFLISGCKKEKGALDGLTPGRFDFVYIFNDNANHDTITGELSGPYVKSTSYIFKIRQELSMDKQLKSFNVGNFKSIINSRFAGQVNRDGVITYEDHNSDYLLVRFESGDTLSGSLTLTRKE